MLRKAAAILLLCSALSSCQAGATGGDQPGTERSRLGLFSSLPIYWGEGADISTMVDGQTESSWVRQVVERQFELMPLDALEPETLAGLDRVLLAQPRPLAPSENVALDDWVRAGGKALIFADPMLTQHSEYALGDRRRPADMVLLSPILGRWGLELQFDADQPPGERLTEIDGIALPVGLAGRFALREGGEGTCEIDHVGLIARCRIGEGTAYLIADAAVLDPEGDTIAPESRADAIRILLRDAFVS